MGINYLNKQSDINSDILSLRSQVLWSPGLDTDLEVAHSEEGSKHGRAFWGRINGTSLRFRYRLSLMHADPEYRGFYRDQEFAFLGVDYSPNDKWDVHGSYRFQRDNLDIDPDRTAPDERQLILGIYYGLFPETRIGIDYRHQTRRDRRALSEFESSHDSVRLTVGQRFKNLSMLISGEWGKTEDDPNRDGFDTALYRISTHWQATKRQSYSANLFYDDNAYTDAREQQRVQMAVGINARYRLFQFSELNLNIQGNPNGDFSPYTFNAIFSHKRPNGHQASLVVRHSTGDADQTVVILNYTVPFDLPVSRKKNVATLRGYIHDVETGEGLANVVLNLGGLTAISDDEGRFTFPSVRVGTHFLSIDRASAALDKVPVNKFPTEIEIRYGGENQIDIPLVQTATLRGQVMVYEAPDPALPSQGYIRAPVSADGLTNIVVPEQRQLAPSYGLQNALVILQNGERTYKRLTDREGRFRISHLSSDRWTVTVDEEGLPMNLELEKRRFTVIIKPGAVANIEFKLIPKVRRIKMLKPLKAIVFSNT